MGNNACREVERIPYLTKRAFHETYVRSNKPVIITGVMHDWPAMTKWTPVYLKQIGGDYPINLEFGNVLQEVASFQYWTFGEYIDWIISQTGSRPSTPVQERIPYLGQFEIFNAFPRLKEDVKNQMLWYRKVYTHYVAWIGPRGARTGLHMDRVNNLHGLIYGRKRWLLYPPDQSRLVYPSRKYDIFARVSSVDVENPDLNRYPRFAEARPLEAVLNSGELLFVPKGWWHYVCNLDVSISVACWGFTLWDLASVLVPEAIRRTLHDIGLYRRGNCTCFRHHRTNPRH